MTADQFVLEVGQALDAIKLVPKSQRTPAIDRVLQMVQEWAFEVEDLEPAPKPRKKA